MKFYLSTAVLTLLGGGGGDMTSSWLETPGGRPRMALSLAQDATEGTGWTRDRVLDDRLQAMLRAAGPPGSGGIPGAVGAVVELGKPTRVGAAGVRKVGGKDPMTASDLVHIGSDTKAMTAVLIARLVQKGKLKWTSTVAEMLPSIAADIHADYRDVTVAQLLRHVAGLPTNPDDWRALAGEDLHARRLGIARLAMGGEPLAAPGTKHIYSNLSVMVAGAMAEAACGETWEDLMRAEIFKPLGMTSAGFGAPGATGKVDQPWGHRLRSDGTFEALQGDNDAALGPAGTVHLSMADWGRFVMVFLEDAAGEGEGSFLSPESRKALLAPGPDGHYGMGWLLVERGWAGGQALSHAGSNTLWYANAWVAPEVDVAFLVAVNAYTPEVAGHLDSFIGQCVMEMVEERAAK